jgi:16S rRNA (uracil1498-N3)-methyltransferase
MDRPVRLDAATTAVDDADLLRRAAGFVYVDDLQAPRPSEDDEHHLLHVLRLRAGEVVIASDGAGAFVPCVIREGVGSSRGKGRAVASSLEVLDAIGPVRTTGKSSSRCVAFAVPKGERAEWTVQKLTEIGIDHIVPLLTERTVVRLSEGEGLRRADRFRRIAREAGAQSRRVHLPVVAAPTTLRALLEGLGAADGEVAIAEPGGGPLTAAMRTVLVGPEGGWSERELGELPTRVGLGSGVLRTETAALVAGTLLVSARSGLIGERDD